MYEICNICKETIKSGTSRGLSMHIKFHHEISLEDYYLKYINSRNSCVDCDKKVRFYGLKNGHSLRCKACSTKI